MSAALTACAPSGESYGLSGSNEKGGSFVPTSSSSLFKLEGILSDSPLTIFY